MVEKIQSEVKNPSGSSLQFLVLGAQNTTQIKNSSGMELLQSPQDAGDAAWILFNMSLQHHPIPEKTAYNPFRDFPRKKRSISQNRCGASGSFSSSGKEPIEQPEGRQDMDDAAWVLFNLYMQHDPFLDFPGKNRSASQNPNWVPPNRNSVSGSSRKITFSGCECSPIQEDCGGSPVHKKRRRTEKGDLKLKPEMPQKVKDVILRSGGSEARLVIQKPLQSSDTNRGQARMQIPKKQVENDFLSEEEERVLNQTNQGIPVLLIQPSNTISTHCLKKRRIGKEGVYQMTGKWNGVVENKANGLATGVIVQIWSFRAQANLCFAMVTL